MEGLELDRGNSPREMDTDVLVWTLSSDEQEEESCNWFIDEK